MRDGIDLSSWKESDEESSRRSIILPPRYCLGGDIYHSPHSGMEGYYISEGIFLGQSLSQRAYEIVYKKEDICSSRSTITPHHQLKSPSSNPLIHYSAKQWTIMGSISIEISVGNISSPLLWISVSR